MSMVCALMVYYVLESSKVLGSAVQPLAGYLHVLVLTENGRRTPSLRKSILSGPE
jgi:hypothetical protein